MAIPRASLWVVRGIRGIVVAVGVWALAGWAVLDETWRLAFGVVAWSRCCCDSESARPGRRPASPDYS